MYIREPDNYEALVTPFAQRLLQFGVDDSKLYLTSAANAVFRAFTQGFTPEDTDRPYDDRKHAIVDGGFIETSLDGSSMIQITLKPSTIIADHTLLIFPEDTMVDVDVEELDPEGEILLFLNFQYKQTVYENKPFVKALYYNNDEFTQDPRDLNSGFDSAADQVVLTRITFEKDETGVTKINSSVVDPYSQVAKNFINVKGNDIEIAPLASMWYRMIDGYHNIHNRKQLFTLDEVTDWVRGIPDFDIGSTGLFHYTILNTNVINQKLCNVQCYIENLKVDPTAIQHIDAQHVKIWMPTDWVEQEFFQTMNVVVIG